MSAPHQTLPDLSVLAADALRALVLEQHERLLSRDIEIENLKLLILKLKRMQFGRKSEKLERQIEQLELRLEDLEVSPVKPEPAPPETLPPAAVAARKPLRRPLPEQLPREVKTYAPKQDSCPDCGGKLSALGEDVSEILDRRCGLRTRRIARASIRSSN